MPEEVRDFLFGLFQGGNEAAGNIVVLVAEESGSAANVTGPTSTTDAMNVIVNVARKVVAAKEDC